MLSHGTNNLDGTTRARVWPTRATSWETDPSTRICADHIRVDGGGFTDAVLRDQKKGRSHSRLRRMCMLFAAARNDLIQIRDPRNQDPVLPQAIR